MSVPGFQEKREQQEFEKKSVTISFPTIADLEELDDEDLKGLGEFVVEIARQAREKREQGLV